MQMAFSVSKSRPFRSLGLYKSSGKHAAPKGWEPEHRPDGSSNHPHRPAHAATTPRLTGPHAGMDPHTETAPHAETGPDDAADTSTDTEEHAA
jgi:hypothetical protein